MCIRDRNLAGEGLADGGSIVITRDVEADKQADVDVYKRQQHSAPAVVECAVALTQGDSHLLEVELVSQLLGNALVAVSYTHLDVYKRQVFDSVQSLAYRAQSTGNNV